MNKFHVFSYLLLDLLLASCSSANPLPTQVSAPTLTSLTPTQTSIPTATPPPTLAIIPTLSPLSSPTVTSTQPSEVNILLPVLTGSQAPWGAQVITTENAGQLTELARWDRIGVLQIAWSPDGSMLAAGVDSGRIELLDPLNGQVWRSLIGHSGRVTSLEFSPDGTMLASGSRDGTTRLWDVNQGKELFRMPAMDDLGWGCGGEPSVAFSPDGKLLAFSGAHGQVKVWDVANHKDLQPLGEQSDVFAFGSVAGVAFSPDGKFLASGYSRTGFCSGELPDQIILWDPTTGQIMSTQRFFGGKIFPNVRSLAFSPDGKTLAVGFHPHGFLGTPGPHALSVSMLDVASGSELFRLSGPWDAAIESLAFSQNGDVLAYAGEVPLTLVNSATGKELIILSDTADVLAWSPDGKVLFSAGNDGFIRLWGIAP
jgi:WD40 repeat protein